jgi:hypothetical protein
MYVDDMIDMSKEEEDYVQILKKQFERLYKY